MKRWLYVVALMTIGGVAYALVSSKWFEQVPFAYVDFDVSMKLDPHDPKLTGEWGKPIMQILKLLYERNSAKKVAYSEHVRIPKIIHQIWLGSPFPEKYRSWQESWKKYHPDWEYRLWTDADIEKLNALGNFFIGDTYTFYQEATNYGEKSDILKILLIYYYGGIYADTDFECLRSLEVLNHCYDLYIGIQPMDVAYIQLGYALFAAYPRHPLIRKVIDMLHTTRHIPEIVCRTGPLMITRCFAEHALSTPGSLVALPASYFYPQGYDQRHEPLSQWIKEESFAVHRWEGSWLKPEANMHVTVPQTTG
jgi:mannosyltransferase OCH1-like enzyme